MFLVILAAAAAVANPAPAAPTPAATAKPVPVAAGATSDDDKVICHSDPDVGSLFVHKTCLTKQQWAALAADSKRAFDDVSRKTGQSVSGN